MESDYKACDHQLTHPPEVRGYPFEEWYKRRPIASQSAIAVWLKKIQAESAEPKKKAPSGAVPANTEWL